MCNYIKDDGEQCGRDNEPFCHDHEDSVQAKQWAMLSEAHTDDTADSRGVPMDTTCETCGGTVRLVRRLSEHPRMGHATVFEETLECACDVIAVRAKAFSHDELPAGWY